MIEQLNGTDLDHNFSFKGKGSIKHHQNKEEIDEPLVQLGIEIFKFVCDVISSDKLSDKETHLCLIIHGIFQYFNKVNNWANFKFAEFVFVAMIFSGESQGLSDNSDFYKQLQRYQQTKIKELMGDAIENNEHLMLNIDYGMLDIIIQNLLRQLMADLPLKKPEQVEATCCNFFAGGSQPGMIKNKLNLMKVLFEMMNFLEISDSENDENGANQMLMINNKLVQDSRVYLQIFIDLIKFISI